MKITLRGEKDFSVIIADTSNDKNVSLEIKSHPYLNIEMVDENKFTI